jgi:hypothetical protein
MYPSTNNDTAGTAAEQPEGVRRANEDLVICAGWLVSNDVQVDWSPTVYRLVGVQVGWSAGTEPNRTGRLNINPR